MTSHRGTFASLTALLTLSLALNGCMSFNPRSVRQVEAALLESNPELELDSEMKLGIGALTMDLVDFVFVHQAEIDLSKLSHVDVGVYAVKSGRSAMENLKVPQNLGRSCPQREVIIRVNEDDEHVEVAVCIRNDKIVGLSMFTLESDELVIVHLRGDLEAFVSSMVRDNVNRS
jgi:hypothetical protein